MSLSIIIPSFKDPNLHKTINSILTNAQTDIEIIPVIDGYQLDNISNDPRVKPVYLTQNVGMRTAINVGVEASKGDYIMRTDEHCMFADSFDKVVLETIQDNWIVVPRRYFLDPYKWEVMPKKGHIDYEKLIIKDTPEQGYKKFSAVKWKARDIERADTRVDETMAMQGSCWIMQRRRRDRDIGKLPVESYGNPYQDSIEMVFKTWQAGGKLMVNKNTWYAHKHRSFNRTHNHDPIVSRNSWEYALGKWEPYYNEIRKQWAI